MAQSMSGLPTCPICIESLDGFENIAACPCGHTFHYVCIDEWAEQCHVLRKPTLCPTCKHRFEINKSQGKIIRLFFSIGDSARTYQGDDKKAHKGQSRELLGKIDALEKELEKSEVALVQAVVDFSNSEVLRNDLETCLKDSNVMRNDLETCLKDSHTKMKELQAKRKDSEVRLNDLETCLRNSRTRVKDSESRMKDLEAKRKDSEVRLNDLETCLKDSKTRMKDSESRMKDLEAKVKDLKIREKVSQAELKDFGTRLKDSEATVRNLRQENAILRMEAEAHRGKESQREAIIKETKANLVGIGNDCRRWAEGADAKVAAEATLTALITNSLSSSIDSAFFGTLADKGFLAGKTESTMEDPPGGIVTAEVVTTRGAKSENLSLPTPIEKTTPTHFLAFSLRPIGDRKSFPLFYYHGTYPWSDFGVAIIETMNLPDGAEEGKAIEALERFGNVVDILPGSRSCVVTLDPTGEKSVGFRAGTSLKAVEPFGCFQYIANAIVDHFSSWCFMPSRKGDVRPSTILLDDPSMVKQVRFMVNQVHLCRVDSEGNLRL